jgi:hypothetical protein
MKFTAPRTPAKAGVQLRNSFDWVLAFAGARKGEIR